MTLISIPYIPFFGGNTGNKWEQPMKTISYVKRLKWEQLGTLGTRYIFTGIKIYLCSQCSQLFPLERKTVSA
jgi:hypothetical protein